MSNGSSFLKVQFLKKTILLQSYSQTLTALEGRLFLNIGSEYGLAWGLKTVSLTLPAISENSAYPVDDGFCRGWSRSAMFAKVPALSPLQV